MNATMVCLTTPGNFAMLKQGAEITVNIPPSENIDFIINVLDANNNRVAGGTCIDNTGENEAESLFFQTPNSGNYEIQLYNQHVQSGDDNPYDLSVTVVQVSAPSLVLLSSNDGQAECTEDTCPRAPKN